MAVVCYVTVGDYQFSVRLLTTESCNANHKEKQKNEYI